MKYRNKKTSAVIDVKSKLTGGGWEPVKKQAKKKDDDAGSSGSKETEDAGKDNE